MQEKRDVFGPLFMVLLGVMALLASPAQGVVNTQDLNAVTPSTVAQTVVPGAALGNVTYTGANTAAGLFTDADAVSGINIPSGIILSSGDIEVAEILPNNNALGKASFVNFLAGDPDLEALIALVQTFDAAVLEFDFTPGPLENVLTLPLVFASEEYVEFVGAINDGVAVWVNGVNVAVVPGSTDPIAISTINPLVNAALFNNNNPFNFGGNPPFANFVQYDGFTDVITMRVPVAPGAVNHIKIAIADEDDNFTDSAVFIGDGVFSDMSPDILALVTQYYNDILKRAPEPGGADFWTSRIIDLVSLGVDIKEGFIALGRLFFNSTEYLNMLTSDTQYVTDLYNAFLGRAPDAGGLAFWEGRLAAGLGRNAILNFFVFSAEFDATLEGLFPLAATRPENNLLNDFYRGILARLPDGAGFDFWLAQLRNAQCAGSAQDIRNLALQITQLFIASAEYVNRGRTNVEYVEDLYNAIMRRSPSLAEFNGWVALLDGGTPRSTVLQSFVNAPEFQTRVQNVIDAGCAVL